jgi:hypothetical protein
LVAAERTRLFPLDTVTLPSTFLLIILLNDIVTGRVGLEKE